MFKTIPTNHPKHNLSEMEEIIYSNETQVFTIDREIDYIWLNTDTGIYVKLESIANSLIKRNPELALFTTDLTRYVANLQRNPFYQERLEIGPTEIIRQFNKIHNTKFAPFIDIYPELENYPVEVRGLYIPDCLENHFRIWLNPLDFPETIYIFKTEE